MLHKNLTRESTLASIEEKIIALNKKIAEIEKAQKDQLLYDKLYKKANKRFQIETDTPINKTLVPIQSVEALRNLVSEISNQITTEKTDPDDANNLDSLQWKTVKELVDATGEIITAYENKDNYSLNQAIGKHLNKANELREHNHNPNAAKIAGIALILLAAVLFATMLTLAGTGVLAPIATSMLLLLFLVGGSLATVGSGAAGIKCLFIHSGDKSSFRFFDRPLNRFANNADTFAKDQPRHALKLT